MHEVKGMLLIVKGYLKKYDYLYRLCMKYRHLSYDFGCRMFDFGFRQTSKSEIIIPKSDIKNEHSH